MTGQKGRLEKLEKDNPTEVVNIEERIRMDKAKLKELSYATDEEIETIDWEKFEACNDEEIEKAFSVLYHKEKKEEIKNEEI